MAVKKLIEVALPLEAINAASAREKSIRFGHPSTLHLWWARRPLAAARAVIWASLVDDPSSHPELFPTEEEQTKERERLFSILEELVVWENSNSEDVLAAATAEIRKSMGNELPPLLDPFAGGGAIPLEAQRLGLKAYAHDLNPVAVTINKAMIEIPPRFANQPAINVDAQQRKHISTWEGYAGIADDVEYYGNWLRERVKERIGGLYPKVSLSGKDGGGEADVIAWLWTRTITCTNPACRHVIPLVKSFDVVTKKGKEAHVVCTTSPERAVFDVKRGKSTTPGTTNRQGAICPHCGTAIKWEQIRAFGKKGKIRQQMMAIAADGPSGRVMVSPNAEQEAAANCEHVEDAPACALVGKSRVNVGLYGFENTESLFSRRQLKALMTYVDLLPLAREKAYRDAVSAGMVDDKIKLSEGGKGATAYSEAVGVYLAFGIDRMTDVNNSLCRWSSSRAQTLGMFGRQAIPMVWDYAENNVFSEAAGDYKISLGSIVRVLRSAGAYDEGVAKQWDAQSDNGLRDIIVSTDPPYYDNIDYADLSDFFYAWMRRTLRDTYPELFRTMATPKAEELVASAYRDYGKLDARSHFEEGMLEAFRQINKYARADVPVTVYYAFKQSETETTNDVSATASTGWETMLSAIIKAGFSIVGTWPMRTERQGRTIGLGSNALASSIVLVCRKRPADAPMATRREFVNTLKRELKPALDKLQTSNIAPVDMAQSAIGPGIGVYSRFSKVLEADGSEMTVRAALQIINQELDLYFSDQDSDLDRDSRFCVDLYTQSAFNEIKFGEADVLARAKNTSIDGLAAKGALFASKGIVRLLGRDELKNTNDWGFTWLFTQQLTHAMETGGVEACAQMLKDVFDSRAENAKALAYRLFTIADKKGWNAEAFAYNSLVVAWPEIQSRAAQLQAEKPVQYTLFDD